MALPRAISRAIKSNKVRSYYCKQKAPTVSDQGCKILLCVRYALKPQLTEYSTLSLASNQVFFLSFLKKYTMLQKCGLFEVRILHFAALFYLRSAVMQ